LGRFGQRPEHSQVIGKALVRCILGKFLGIVCHFFPPFQIYESKILKSNFDTCFYFGDTWITWIITQHHPGGMYRIRYAADASNIAKKGITLHTKKTPLQADTLKKFLNCKIATKYKQDADERPQQRNGEISSKSGQNKKENVGRKL